MNQPQIRLIFDGDSGIRNLIESVIIEIRLEILSYDVRLRKTVYLYSVICRNVCNVFLKTVPVNMSEDG